jgi:pilus assembly protein CpaB
VVVRTSLLIAARPLRAGAQLRPEDLASSVFEGTAPAGTLMDTQAVRLEIAGGLIRRSIGVGEQLQVNDVLRPGEHGFLAAVLGPGMRAISIGVDAVSGAAGLIWPGDRVDVILTQTLDEGGAPIGRRIAGETVMASVLVLAVDQQLVQGASIETGSGLGGIVPGGRTVTLEVSPRDAEKLSVASRIGRLSLSVRSALKQPGPLSDVTGANGEPVTWGDDVSGALRAPSGPVEQRNLGPGIPAPPMRIFNGPARSEEVRF